MQTVQKSQDNANNKIWGRASQVSLISFLGSLSLLLFSPFLVAYFVISAFFFDCSLLAPLLSLYQKKNSLSNLFTLIPFPSFYTAAIYASWLTLQVVLALTPDLLHRFIPRYQGGKCLGSVTPAGNRHVYNINGLQAWVVSHLLFIAGAFIFGFFSPTIIFDQWGPLFWMMNIAGFSLAIFVYVKAYLFPSFADDRKFTGNFIYDFFMGIELNPRVKNFDIKLFFNGRPGIVAWTLINLSFASTQYVRYGHVTNSMLLVNLFQFLYVIYFFWKESWYLKTIDIHHDHFGWMLAWGDCVWLPYMYTLQGLFLVIHPVELSSAYALFVLFLGLIGFYIFASANNQKDSFRNTDGKNRIWGKEPESISCSYVTLDGSKRETKLLLSGWWGISRHMNYTGDLLLSLAYSLACGTEYLFPYFYFFFLSILLIHRCIRDEERCGEKYGPAWKEYCKRVPYRLVPYIW
jgi:7-dehydrocholesterol reductase